MLVLVPPWCFTNSFDMLIHACRTNVVKLHIGKFWGLPSIYIPVEPTHIQNISKSNYKACNLKHHGCFPYKNPFLLLITMLFGAVCLIWTKGGTNKTKVICANSLEKNWGLGEVAWETVLRVWKRMSRLRTDTHTHTQTCEVSAIILWKKELAINPENILIKRSF